MNCVAFSAARRSPSWILGGKPQALVQLFDDMLHSVVELGDMGLDSWPFTYTDI